MIVEVCLSNIYIILDTRDKNFVLKRDHINDISSCAVLGNGTICGDTVSGW